MTHLILHHYPQSPVTEKVRVALGVKGLEWQSVEVSRIPPRPDLMPMTGGYRRTPVMQIGADIYCDSQCILNELELRYPNPPLLSAPLGEMERGVCRWIDGAMFSSAIAVVLGSAKDLPPEFAADRVRLYFGEDFEIEDLQESVAHHITQLNGQLAWINDMLQLQSRAGYKYLSGGSPGLLDITTYYIVWFLSGRWEDGKDFLSQFDALSPWQELMTAVGHGNPTETNSADALQTAIDTAPTTPMGPEFEDASGVKIGSEVAVQPDSSGGDPEVEGRVVLLNANRIAIARNSDVVGEVVVHFPRVGYRVRVLK